jgi:hypothetical protein
MPASCPQAGAQKKEDPTFSGRASGSSRLCCGDQPFTLSFRAFATVILTTLSAGFEIISPVEGLRT